MTVEQSRLHALIVLALAEDIGSGDVTANATISDASEGRAEIRAKQNLVLAGMETLQPVWQAVDPEVQLNVRAANGDRLTPGSIVAVLDGRVRALLAGERTCLNFLCHLSGVATNTARYVEAASGTHVQILDTRKTTPAWRSLEKAAVRAGGGVNHRMGLYDQILIKDNHVDAAGGIGAAIDRVKRLAPGLRIEVEVRNEDELAAALLHGADIILLDNMSLEQIRRAVEVTAGRAQLEVSGGVTLEHIAELAATGVDRISCGALTHSAPAADLHMKLVTA
ncbi:MAG: carboxylating nicotinate-nucleotide diphosphorylase [Candidatus Lernaella stagnicola]|nr:carboxylating nicotinate-nucleotide diphosphorylase [Candidatus Lernaella stagnicola]